MSFFFFLNFNWWIFSHFPLPLHPYPTLGELKKRDDVFFYGDGGVMYRWECVIMAVLWLESLYKIAKARGHTHTHTQKEEEEEEASETISNLILLYPRRKARALGEMSKKEGGKKKKKNGREREKIYKKYIVLLLLFLLFLSSFLALDCDHLE